MDAVAFQISSAFVCWTVSPGADQRKHQSFASLAFVRGSYRWPVVSLTKEMFPFDGVIMFFQQLVKSNNNESTDGLSTACPVRQQNHQISALLDLYEGNHNRPGVGVTKAPSVNLSVSKIFDLAKVYFRFFESHSYLAGVTAAGLRRHLPNINVIFNT